MSVKVLSEIEGPWGTIQGHPIMAQMGNGGPGRRRCLPEPHSLQEKQGQEGGLLTCDYPCQHTSLSLPVCDRTNDLSPGRQETSLLAPCVCLKSLLLGSHIKAFCITGRSSWITSQGPSYPGIVMLGTSVLGRG